MVAGGRSTAPPRSSPTTARWMAWTSPTSPRLTDPWTWWRSIPPTCPWAAGPASTLVGMVSRYGMRDAPRTPAGVRRDIAAGMAEAYRVLRRRGLLLVKCQDYISSGRYQPGTAWAMADAEAIGFIDRPAGVRGSSTAPASPPSSGPRSPQPLHAPGAPCILTHASVGKRLFTWPPEQHRPLLAKSERDQHISLGDPYKPGKIVANR